MLDTVFRYRLPITDHATISMPAGAKVLSFGPPRDHHDALDIWARVNPNSPLVEHRYCVVGTGHPIPDEAGDYQASVTTHGGALVFHVFTAA